MDGYKSSSNINIICYFIIEDWMELLPRLNRVTFKEKLLF